MQNDKNFANSAILTSWRMIFAKALSANSRFTNFPAMQLRFIQTEADFRAAMRRIDELISLDPREGTKQIDELDAISSMIASYEDIHYPID